MTRFIDTNVFVYLITAHPKFGQTAKQILQRVQEGESAMTTTIVLCEIAWVLEAMGRPSEIKPTLEKILSYESLEVADVQIDDLLIGADNQETYKLDFNDGVNIAILDREGITEAYSNDNRHLGKVEFLRLFFE